MTLGTAASVRIAGETDDRNIDRYELASARRALRLIKGNLGDRLHALVGAEIAVGNAFFRDHVRRSGGEQVTGTLTIEARGLTAAAFSAWMIRAFTREDVLIAAQPEHYLMDMADPRGPHIVETLGEHVVGFRMGGWDESEVPGGTDRRHSLLTLDDDGTVVGSVSTSFREADHGMTAELSVTLPATSAPEAVEQHLQHFSVEFRSWMLLAAAETGEGSR
ncbi:hypothetical protein VA596_12235 [Amycolatopsis sp., V23-08]|uniref:Uncharacterized protein n=1 Tax=Amycolatopsis heterodermiae TaxID=3110235 RepID=A0ABU5R4S5_9PSEU|nr:hypothetical protein [Amycolatopsis sp., V23-08]MEA5360306.1 hypothetical protein [Amycolatopsis sp., V23-08]